MRRSLIAILALGLGLVMMAAPAVASPDPETDEIMARQLFSAGELRFQQGDYRRAIAAFLSADLLAPSAIYVFDIAVCHERLGNSAEAVRYYRAYLNRDPDAVTFRTAQARIDALSSVPRLVSPERAPLATGRKARCESTHPDLRDPLPSSGVAEVTIVSQPASAAVFCHGKRLGQTPLRVAVERQRSTSLVVSRRGYLDEVVRVDGERAVEQPVLRRLARVDTRPMRDPSPRSAGARVNPDLKDPMEDLR